MTNDAFLFPGQGSQSVGMGKDLYRETALGKKLFDRADEVLGYRLSRLCFEGPEEELKLTSNTQPALLTVSYILYRLLEKEPAMAAGHSLGEYSAHLCAGTISFEDALQLVHKRGTYMQEAVPVGKGSMAALIGPGVDEVRKVLDSIPGTVGVANHNSEKQIVISGEKEAVQRAVEEINAQRSVFLKVSAPFHSEMMVPAQKKLAKDLDCTSFHDPAFPVISNVTATECRDGETARKMLREQVSRPVLWYQTMQYLLKEKAVERFAEVGTGRVLAGLLRRTARGMKPPVEVVGVGDLQSLQAFPW